MLYESIMPRDGTSVEGLRQPRSGPYGYQDQPQPGQYSNQQYQGQPGQFPNQRYQEQPNRHQEQPNRHQDRNRTQYQRPEQDRSEYTSRAQAVPPPPVLLPQQPRQATSSGPHPAPHVEKVTTVKELTLPKHSAAYNHVTFDESAMLEVIASIEDDVYAAEKRKRGSVSQPITR